jgi:adenylate kinase
MNRPQVVAVVGLSGVGKSTALEAAHASLAFEHLQASALIKAERERWRQAKIDHDALREANINDNQALLVGGFRHTAPKAGLVILDGHTVIDTPDGLVEIEPKVFRMLGVSRFVVLTEEPEEIYRRRSADPGRKRPMRSVDELRQQQERSILVAHRAALDLRVPLVVLVCQGVQDFVEALQREP